MRRALAILAFGILLWPTTVAAQTYSAFGNLWTNDCQFEADANLVLHEYPHAHITTSEVVNAYHVNEKSLDVWSGLDYLEDVGFDGYRATYTEITSEAQIIYAANHGGVWATMFNGSHAVGIIAATPSWLETVDDGVLQKQSWSNWYYFAGHQWQFYFALSWMPRNTETLYFQGSYETSTMTPQTEPYGVTAPIEANGFVEDGWTFLGWNTQPDGSGTMYQSGEPWHFVSGATLYAQWNEN